jgi:hypothetical protein
MVVGGMGGLGETLIPQIWPRRAHGHIKTKEATLNVLVAGYLLVFIGT